ncbi:AAA family ATPase [uncultured Fibrella sp.]|uniref:AAA family ATPase n=1 Tax=uncultured Fibrella sp. TaxID=1284596 RepID=UPI0035CC8358
MQIKRLVIENFKSIERIELIEPNPFTVFVGPNGSGKSNIFEALEFINYISVNDRHAGLRLFGGRDNVVNRKNKNDIFRFSADFNGNTPDFANFEFNLTKTGPPFNYLSLISDKGASYRDFLYESGNWFHDYSQFYDSFSRLFIGDRKAPKIDFQDDEALNTTASNLEKVLKRILTDEVLKREIFEWLELFVPGFKAVEIDDRDELHWFEESSDRYFTKDLISDGTYNILSLLTAVYQQDHEPQFLCIEEPENGLHPKVARELMDFFRLMCEERGHYIWVNTHSPYMASRVRPEELVTVNKINGSTQVKQFKGMNWHGLTADEVWLSNVLGGGNPW